MSTARLVTRFASVSKRGSSIEILAADGAAARPQSELLATPSVRYASLAWNTSYGTMEGCWLPRRVGRPPPFQ